MPTRQTAEALLTRGQVLTAAGAMLIVVDGLSLAARVTSTAVAVAVTGFFAVFVALKLVLHVVSIAAPPVAAAPVDLSAELPGYTVLVPLYREANMIPSLVRALNGLHYPKDKLQVLLLLEEDDAETLAAADQARLPAWWQIVRIPDCRPKGKPKALNVGLAAATGEFTVIYDAEDRPDPDQLLKAVGAFRAGRADLACVQARLVFWNPGTSWVTRFYWSEYVVHFERVLPGLARLGLIPPLGGTSNHFRTSELHRIAIPGHLLPAGAAGVGGWDPWNVTEDAELAGALAGAGCRVAMIDSVTREEATARLRVADRQRRRWLKGYLQTGLVYTRHPVRTARRIGTVRWAVYSLLMLGTPLGLVLSPLLWLLTAASVLTGSPVLRLALPGSLGWAELGLFVAGNVLLLAQLNAASFRRYGPRAVRFVLLTPLWWAFTSWSAYLVLWELLRPSTRHTWNKTPHGHDLDKELHLELDLAAPVGTADLPAPAPAVGTRARTSATAEPTGVPGRPVLTAPGTGAQSPV